MTEQVEETDSKKKMPWGTILLALGGVGVGMAIGPQDAEVVTETVTETEYETVTEEVEVEVTPEACITALDQADVVNYNSGLLFSLAGDAIFAAEAWDAEELNSITAEIDTIRPDLDAALAAYQSASEECRP